MPLIERKRKVGWVRRLQFNATWRAVTEPLEFDTDVRTVLKRLGYVDGDHEPNWSTLILDEGVRPCSS